MGALSERFRTDAAKLRDSAAEMLKTPDIDTNPTNQLAVIVSMCNANNREALADVLDYISASGLATGDLSSARRKAVIERNDLIRKTAARASITGDWNEFDRLVADTTGTAGA